MEAKERLREQMRRRLVDLDPDRRLDETRRTRRRLDDLPAIRQAERLLVYASTDREVPTLDLISDLLQAGREVAVPRVEGASLLPVRIASTDDLAPGAFGVPEPVEGRPLKPGRLDVAVVPGLAFDDAGRRLGRGGGHFDRFLAAFPHASVGLAFDCQLVDEVPTEPHDEPVDLVVHASGVERRATP